MDNQFHEQMRSEGGAGGTLGDLYGQGFARVPEGTVITLEDGTQQDISGEILFDSKTGYPIIDKTNYKYLGNTQNKWKAGFNNSFSYAGFNLSVLVDAQFGGKAYSLTHSMLSMTGKTKNTLEGRYDGVIGDGYCYNASTGEYTRNRTVCENVGYYYDQYYGRDNVEANIFSTSFIKLREVSLSYTLPSKIIDKIKVLRGLTVSVYGRNLAMWTRWPQYDPEVAALSGSTITTGMETVTFPMTRSYGFNIKLKF